MHTLTRLASIESCIPATLDLSQAAATYTALTAGANLLLLGIAWRVTTVGATFTSVSVQDDEAVPQIYLSAADGAVANVLAGSVLVPYTVPGTILRSGKRIRYTMVVRCRPITPGAVLS